MTDNLTRRARFEALYADHLGAVRSWAQRRSDRDESQEVVAETFLVAWRRLDAVPSEARPWLLAAANHVLANRRRSDRRRGELIERLLRDAPPATAAAEPPTAIDADLIAALNRLRPTDRELLLLVALDELPIGEAAVVVGLHAVTARVRLHRARARLQRELRSNAPAAASVSIPTEERP